jgi:hypothetical protein
MSAFYRTINCITVIKVESVVLPSASLVRRTFSVWFNIYPSRLYFPSGTFASGFKIMKHERSQIVDISFLGILCSCYASSNLSAEYLPKCILSVFTFSPILRLRDTRGQTLYACVCQHWFSIFVIHQLETSVCFLIISELPVSNCAVQINAIV